MAARGWLSGMTLARLLFPGTSASMRCQMLLKCSGEVPYGCTRSDPEGMAAAAGPSWNQKRNAPPGLVSFLAADQHPRGIARAGGSGVLRLSLVPLTARRALNLIYRDPARSLGLVPASALELVAHLTRCQPSRIRSSSRGLRGAASTRGPGRADGSGYVPCHRVTCAAAGERHQCCARIQARSGPSCRFARSRLSGRSLASLASEREHLGGRYVEGPRQLHKAARLQECERQRVRLSVPAAEVSAARYWRAAGVLLQAPTLFLILSAVLWVSALIPGAESV
jgi:hypothetical protein